MYGFTGSMKAKPGHRDDVAAILVSGASGVGVQATPPTTLSNCPPTKAAIAQATPMLTGEFNANELTVIGGLGV